MLARGRSLDGFAILEDCVRVAELAGLKPDCTLTGILIHRAFEKDALYSTLCVCHVCVSFWRR